MIETSGQAISGPQAPSTGVSMADRHWDGNESSIDIKEKKKDKDKEKKKEEEEEEKKK